MNELNVSVRECIVYIYHYGIPDLYIHNNVLSEELFL